MRVSRVMRVPTVVAPLAIGVAVLGACGGATTGVLSGADGGMGPGASSGSSSGGGSAYDSGAPSRDASIVDSGPCAPACAGNVCGAPDGCGGTCQEGSCGPGTVCSAGA